LISHKLCVVTDGDVFMATQRGLGDSVEVDWARGVCAGLLVLEERRVELWHYNVGGLQRSHLPRLSVLGAIRGPLSVEVHGGRGRSSLAPRCRMSSSRTKKYSAPSSREACGCRRQPCVHRVFTGSCSRAGKRNPRRGPRGLRSACCCSSYTTIPPPRVL